MSSSTLHLGANTKLLASGSCCLCVLLRQNAHMVHGRHICALIARHCPTPTGNGIASPFLVLLLRNRVSLCISGYPRFPCYPGCHQTRSNPPASALPSSSNSKYKSQYPISVSSFFYCLMLFWVLRIEPKASGGKHSTNELDSNY